jgi:hypothetical protein
MAFGEYRGRCIGRVMRFLYEIDIRSDECIFGPERTLTIGHEGPLYASYSWRDNTDIPEIVYHGQFAHLNDRKKAAYDYILNSLEAGRDHRVVFNIAAVQLPGCSGVKYTECELRNIPNVNDIITVSWDGKNERRKVVKVDDDASSVLITTTPYNPFERA